VTDQDSLEIFLKCNCIGHFNIIIKLVLLLLLWKYGRDVLTALEIFSECAI